MGVRDFGGLERGRSQLWISNHPRFHGSAWKVLLGISNHPRFHGSAWKVLLGISNHPRYHSSAWKVPALDIEPSTISRFSVESPRSEYRTIHDFMVQRGRSPLWISNHPRYHGSASKVTALNIEPSTISWVSVEGTHPEAVTKRAERANGGTRAACFEQPEGVYSGCVDARPTKYTSSYSVSTHPGYEA